jgi:hypothetical protein
LFLGQNEDGKIRTEHLAQLALHAALGVLHARRMITFDVIFLGHLQYVLGTIFHAEATSFAAIDDDVDLTVGNFDLIAVQRPPPIFHRPFLTIREPEMREIKGIF